MYLNTFNLWAFDVGLPLCYDVGNYPILVTTSLWCLITLSLWCVITPSLWRQVKLEASTLHDMDKSLSVWVRLLPIWPKDHMQKGYCVTHHSLLPMGGRGKSLGVWVRPGRAKSPHTKEVLRGTLSPTAHWGGGGGGIGKSLKLWVRLGSTNKPHVKRGTYHASVFGFRPVCGGMMSQWHFRLFGTLGEVSSFEMVLDIFMAHSESNIVS